MVHFSSNPGLASVALAQAHDLHQQSKLKKLSQEAEKIHHQIIVTLLPLKTHLSSLKATQTEGPYDLSSYAPLVHDFQRLYRDLEQELDSSAHPIDFLPVDEVLPENLKALSKKDFLSLHTAVEEIEVHHKYHSQDVAQQLSFDMQLNITHFHVFNELIKSYNHLNQTVVQNSRHQSS